MGQPQSVPTPIHPRPQPGDHIYSERNGRLYDHHGIYVGNDMVIHLQGPAKKTGPFPCEKCGDKQECNGGIIKTCLDCFLDGDSLQIYEYGVPVIVFNYMRRRGTCSVSHSKPAHEVIKAATDLLEGNGFGNYDFFANNCEDFAVYCKTGNALSLQVVGAIEGAALLGPPVMVAYAIAKAITNAQRRP